MRTSIKKVIVPLDPSDYAKAATIRACEVADAHEASITGLTVLDSPAIRRQVAPVDPYLPILVEESIRNFTKDARDQIAKVRSEFEATCERNQIAYLNPQLEGVPASLILEASALHDLIVIGLRTFFHFETSPKPGDSLAAVLRRTVTPILAVPMADPDEPFRRALIAYDGSMNAARTLREFIAFAAPLDIAITVMTANINEKQALWDLEAASGYLRAHGVTNFETEHLKEKTIPEYILDEYDLIVAGIHSSRLVKDRFTGSLTKKLIERNDTALFLSQ